MFLLPLLCVLAVPTAHLHDSRLEVTVRGGGITGLRAHPSGHGRASLDFARDLRPEGWEETPATQVRATQTHATVSPLRIWRGKPLRTPENAPAMRADLLAPGHTLAQTFRVGPAGRFSTVAVKLPTWHTRTSGALLSLYRDSRLVKARRLRNVPDNSWQELTFSVGQGEGLYRVTLSEPVGQIGWWTSGADLVAGGEAEADGRPAAGDRMLSVNVWEAVGEGRLDVAIEGGALRITAEGPPAAEWHGLGLPWRWRMSWTKAGYDCTPRAGVLVSRFFTDNQRYMPVEQLKRRDTAGLSFDGCRWIEMEGNRDADWRIEAARLHLHWELSDREMSLRIDTPLARRGDGVRSTLTVRALPRRDSVPDSFARFDCSDPAVTRDLNRLWWERAFTYPSAASGAAAWFEWMALMRGWQAGPMREGEVRALREVPITPEGYVHTWGADPGWPLRPTPQTDTRHFDTNARYILACWRQWLWSGDLPFLRSQAERLRRAMRYQLDTLRGREGLIVTVSKDVQGRHGDQSDNYWDILPFGHLDAYNNAVFYGSLKAMAQIDAALGAAPLADYAALRRKVYARYDEAFWNEAAGRYIGCVDVDGKRHDYGFTFVNLEALFYGLGDARKARRIYHWMETEPTSSGRADTYTKWIFAPRTNTLHDPEWSPPGPSTPSTPGPRPSPGPWWVSWWRGTPYGAQCQDGGAILYTSFFDLMDRQRHLGPDDAWRRWTAILGRCRMPDRLCGGAPLYRGEIPQQEDPGSVGVDMPFPESGLVPCWFLYGVMGLEPTPAGLRIAPRLPRALRWAEVRGVRWRGHMLRVRVTRTTAQVWSRPAGRRTLPLGEGGVALLRP